MCRIFEWLHKNTIFFFFFLMLQETFDAGLQAFQQEGIANITALKDQLLAAKHIQSKAIEARHASLMKRWNQLLSNSAARKKKLLEAQEHFRKVSGQTLGLQKSECSLWKQKNAQPLHLLQLFHLQLMIMEILMPCHKDFFTCLQEISNKGKLPLMYVNSRSTHLGYLHYSGTELNNWIVFSCQG